MADSTARPVMQVLVKPDRRHPAQVFSVTPDRVGYHMERFCALRREARAERVNEQRQIEIIGEAYRNDDGEWVWWSE